MALRRGVLGPAVAGLVVLAAGVGTATGWVDWAGLGRWLRPHVGLLMLFAAAAALLATAAIRALRRAPRRRTAPALSWWVVAAAGAVVAGVAWGATAWLLREANHAQDPAAARVEAIKTGLTIGAGTGGVFALLLAVRRQWHQELSSAATELDAAERRVTELYTKAADQLGSAQAPVRLAGLYALERVAQNSPEQRQTIVNVLCAYLRMPFTVPGEPPLDDADEKLVEAHREQVQEREVRLTAQRLLTDHLQPGDADIHVTTFWEHIDLDLTAATLIDFDLVNCVVHTATLRSVTFTGGAYFRSVTFTGGAYFDSAIFTGDATFESATFTGPAWFRSTIFTGGATFRSATFTGGAYFRLAIFTGGATFESATFPSLAYFESATFTGGATFESATFTGGTYFGFATFESGVPSAVLQFLPPTSDEQTAQQSSGS